jgi:hypothetical protein
VALKKVESLAGVVPVGMASDVRAGGTTLELYRSQLAEGVILNGDGTMLRQLGSLHGQYAYVPSTFLDGVRGRPSWLLGQMDTLECVTGTEGDGAYFKDGLTGDEHGVNLAALSLESLVVLPRAVAVFGLFDSALVSRNSPERVRSVSLSMLRHLREGKMDVREIIDDYFLPGTQEAAILRTIDRTKLSEDWFETDEFGSSVTLPRQQVIDQFHRGMGRDTTQVPVRSIYAPPAHELLLPPVSLTPELPSRPATEQASQEAAVDDFLSRMTSHVPHQGTVNKPDKREFSPGERSRRNAGRILAERHRGKTPHSLVMEQARTVSFQPYPARLVALYQGAIGSRFMSIRHLKYLRPDELMEEPELQSGNDYTSPAKLPSLIDEASSSNDVRLCLRGLRTFAKSYWQPSIVNYCVELESYFERIFEANEGSVGDWALVLKVFDSLIQDTFTKITCAESELGDRAMESLSTNQLSASNETVRSLWDRITGRASTTSGSKRKAEKPQSRQGSDKQGRSTRLSELLSQLPLSDGKRMCVKFLLGTCPGIKEGECPLNKSRVHKKTDIPSETLEGLRSVFGSRRR